MLAFLVDEQSEAVQGSRHLELDLSLPNLGRNQQSRKLPVSEPTKVRKRWKNKAKVLNPSSSRNGKKILVESIGNEKIVESRAQVGELEAKQWS